MARRAFICCAQKFPRGSAGANYLQYFGLALMEKGVEVIIISNQGIYDKCKYTDGDYSYKNIKLVVPDRIDLFGFRYIEAHYTGWKNYAKEIERFNPTSDDAVIIYFSNPYFIRGLRLYAKKRGMRTAACVVEYFSENEFSGTSKRRNYRLYKKGTDIEIPKCDVVFAISTFIKKVFDEFPYDTKVVVVPIMADVDEFNPYYNKITEDKTVLIYPANGFMKDDIQTMIIALSDLNIDLLENLEFHITNFDRGEDTIGAALDLISDISKKTALKRVIFYHGWMEYHELVGLYRRSDFLLLARQDSQMTRANFPSKIPETMSFGIVPIATDVGDYTKYYLKDGENSIIFHGGDSNSCSVALNRALKVDKRQLEIMSKNAYNTAREKFDYHNWADLIYKSLFYADVSMCDGRGHSFG